MFICTGTLYAISDIPSDEKIITFHPKTPTVRREIAANKVRTLDQLDKVQSANHTKPTHLQIYKVIIINKTKAGEILNLYLFDHNLNSCNFITSYFFSY